MKNSSKNRVNKRCFFSFFLVVGIWCTGSQIFCQEDRENRHEPIVENVLVTNIEVPVRVLLKGKPVDNLTAADFTIYEDGEEVQINGFFVKRKKIDFFATPVDTGGSTQTANGQKKKERTFVLVFNITDYNDSFKDAVEYLFKNILQKGDRVMIFANDQTLEYQSLDDLEKVKATLSETLKAESKKARRRLIDYINRVELLLNMHDFRVQLSRRDDPPQRLIDFLKKYLINWTEYKRQYLTPRTERFYYFSRYLQNIPGEKWVLNFFQFELFPNIRLESQTMMIIRSISTELIESGNLTQRALGQLINNLLNQIMVELNVNYYFNQEEISKLFYKVNATFHSFFIKSTNKILLNDLEYQDVASGVETLLKDITLKTGGKTITSNNISRSLEQVSTQEDIYYLITYAPHDAKKAGRLKIKVKNRKCKVLYDDNFRSDYINDYFNQLDTKVKIPGIKIINFSFNNRKISFTVNDFLMRDSDDNTEGKTRIHIRITDDTNQTVFDQERLLTAWDKEINISLYPFHKDKEIKKGEYHFLINAQDLLTGKEANFHQSVWVKKDQ